MMRLRPYHRSFLHPITILAFVLLTVSGCSDGPGGGSGVSVTEADGRLRVELPALDALDPPRWVYGPGSSTATTAPDLDLFRVTAARFLPSGALAVASSGNQEVVVLDADGSVGSRLGRDGEGPGEFRAISALLVDDEDRLVVYDPSVGRLTTFATDGSVAGTRPLAPPNRVVDLQPLALLDDGRVLAIYGAMRFFLQGGEARDTTPLMVFDSAGAVADTLRQYAAREWAFVGHSRGAARTEVGFGRSLAYDGRSGRAVLGSTDSLALTVYGADGEPVMEVAGGGPGPVVPDTELEAWREAQDRRFESAPAAIREAFSDIPHRERYPAFDGLLLDDAHRIWIGHYPAPSDTLRHWTVLGPDGHIAGRVTLPVDITLLDAAGDRLAVLQMTELGEPQVAVLVRSGGDADPGG